MSDVKGNFIDQAITLQIKLICSCTNRILAKYRAFDPMFNSSWSVFA